MKQTVTDRFAMDEFVSDDVQAPRVYDLPPTRHFVETAADLERQALHAQVVPLLTSSLQRRIAAMMILDQVPITMPEFRDLKIDRKTLTKAKHEVVAAMHAASAPHSTPRVTVGTLSGSPQPQQIMEGPVVKKMWANSRRMNVLKGLATGRTFTFEEFRDELVNKDERIARKIIQWLAGPGGPELGATVETQIGSNRRVTSIRLLNVDEVVQRLQQVTTKAPATRHTAHA